MYPMGLFNSNSTGQNNSLAIATGASITGDVITGQDILTGTTGTNIVAITTGNEIDSGHGSATDPNFSDINTLMNDVS